MKKIISKEVDIVGEVANYFKPYVKEIIFEPKKSLYAFRSGRAVTKSIFDAMCVILKLFQYPGTSALVNVPDFSTLGEKFWRNLTDAITIFQIPEGSYTQKLGRTKDTTIFKVHHPGGLDSYIQFCCVNEGDLKAQGGEPRYSKYGWCHRLDYEVGTWVNWDLRGYINFNTTFDRSCVYYKKGTREIAKKNDPSATTPFCIVAEYNMPARSKKQYKFMKELDAYFSKNDDVTRLVLNYTMMTEEEKLRFLGPKFLKTIDNIKLYAPLEYKEVYLGEENAGGDSVYPTFDKNKALLAPETPWSDGIDWFKAKCVIGVDIGIHDATCMTARIQWMDRKTMKNHTRTIAQWYHCNQSSRYEKWDPAHRTRESAVLYWEYYTPMDYCYMIHDFIQYVHRLVYDKLQLNQIITLQMDTVNAVAGATWYSMLFIPNSDGRSVLFPHQPGGTPSWLNPLPSWQKFGETKEERIPVFIHMFTIPNCYTTLSELECDAFEVARWRPDHTRDENPADLSLLTDVINSVEYSFLYEDYYDFEQFYSDWMNTISEK